MKEKRSSFFIFKKNLLRNSNFKLIKLIINNFKIIFSVLFKFNFYIFIQMYLSKYSLKNFDFLLYFYNIINK